MPKFSRSNLVKIALNPFQRISKSKKITSRITSKGYDLVKDMKKKELITAGKYRAVLKEQELNLLKKED